MSDESEYSFVARLLVHEAKYRLDALVAADIDFHIETNSDAMQQMSRVTAAYGGMYGTGSVIELFVANSQLEAARAILKEFETSP